MEISIFVGGRNVNTNFGQEKSKVLSRTKKKTVTRLVGGWGVSIFFFLR